MFVCVSLCYFWQPQHQHQLRLSPESPLFIPPYIVGWDTKCTVCFLFVCMYGYRSLSRGFTDRHKILHGGSPDLRLVFSYFGGIAPGMAEFWALIGRHMAGYASCWSICWIQEVLCMQCAVAVVMTLQWLDINSKVAKRSTRNILYLCH